jgi:glyoxylase-like metal-dependent hydrolase (beta-lactamase superfamily II)
MNTRHRLRNLARLLLSVTLLSFASTPAVAAGTPASPAWEIYALRYATLSGFPVSALVAGADTSRTLDIAMMFWLMRDGRGRVVLLDAGFYRQKFIYDWKPADYEQPSEVVAGFGVSPDSVTDIIVSHVHWDHLDGADLFPRARVWIQKAEFEYYVNADGFPAHAAIDTMDAAMLAQLDQDGRVTRIDGDGQEIIPGITVYTGGRHTYASQYAGVRTKEGTVVLASDNVYLYENLAKHVPIAQTLDAASNLAAQDRMKRIASGPHMIVPGHDPRVFEEFPAAGPRAVRIDRGARPRK